MLHMGSRRESREKGSVLQKHRCKFPKILSEKVLRKDNTGVWFKI